MKLKSLPRQLGYILGAQWTRDLSWTIFTILLARRSPEMLGQIAVALSCGYLVKTVSDVGLNDFLLSTFARREERPRTLLGEVTGLKTCFMMLALIVTWFVTGWLGYSFELRLIVLFIATGFGLDGVTDSFFALCQARGRQDVHISSFDLADELFDEYNLGRLLFATRVLPYINKEEGLNTTETNEYYK